MNTANQFMTAKNCCARLMLAALAGMALLVVPAARGQGGSSMGQQMRQVQDDLQRATQRVPEERKEPEVDIRAEELEEPEEPAEATEPATDAEPEPEEEPKRPPRGEGHQIREIEIRGDADVLTELGLQKLLEEDCVGKTLTDRQIQSIARRYSKLLVEGGYYLAAMSTPPTDYSQGVLVFEVDEGRIGNLAFLKEKDGEKTPYKGRWYSEKQLRRGLDNVREGAPFDYAEFYKSVWTINSHPDLTMDTDLSVRREREDGALRRFVDMDFTVREKIPLHGVFEINNTGTQATEEWRVALTLQHLNLTRHGDVLTLTVPMSIDFSTLQSVAGSYYVPYHAGKGGTFTVFGGYSELDSNDIVPNIDLLGKGWFAGAQGSYNLVRNDAHELRLALGFAHQFIEDELILEEAATVPREVSIAPISLVLTWTTVRPDFFGGRNFLTSQTSGNWPGVLGASDDDEIRQFRETAEANYYIQRLQYARIQPLGFPRSREDGQKWILFLKLDGQYASGPLIPAEQKAVGGMDNVRGYEEREILGDYGISGSLELRSPIATRSWSGKAVGRETSDRLQFVAFVDGAAMYLDDVPPAIEDSTTLLSVGAGLRLAVTGYSQFKFDYGFPLEETFLSDSSGRGHLAFEVQF